MSYSNSLQAATAYREREVLTASPARLVVIVYDHVLANLRRARLAAQADNLSARLEALTSARAGVMELLAAVDVEKGGPLGANLRAIYGFVHTQLVDESRRPDASRLERITAIVTDLRNAFDTIAVDARVPAA